MKEIQLLFYQSCYSEELIKENSNLKDFFHSYESKATPFSPILLSFKNNDREVSFLS